MKKYELELNESNIKSTILDDSIYRNDKLISIIKILNNLNDNFIISIDGPWGSGKTFFVQQLLYLNQNLTDGDEPIGLHFTDKQNEVLSNFADKYFVFYYNAWQNDNHVNPLESIIYNILDRYPKIKKNIANPQNLFEGIKPLLTNIISKTTLGIITKECFDELKSFDQLSSEIYTIEKKKNNLDELFNIIIPSDKRILLIIDELDRCNPTFAVKMIETIKHFYNNPKITIMVVTYNKQLAETIKHFYGSNFDGYGYLNKIYDTAIELKNENIDKYVQKYCDIYKKTDLPENISYLLFKFLNFSYRECNKYMTMYNICKSYVHYKSDFNPNEYLVESSIILPIMLALKIKDIDEYERLLQGNNEEFLVKFIDYILEQDNQSSYERWLDELLSVNNDGSSIAQKLVERYKKLIRDGNKYGTFPYLDAITLLGNRISMD